MTGISLRLIPSEIDRVAAYAASLPGGRQHPVFREASLAERRDDPRSGASVPQPHEAGPQAAADRTGYGEHLPPHPSEPTVSRRAVIRAEGVARVERGRARGVERDWTYVRKSVGGES